MQWTMPLRTRQIVASLIGLSALTSFVVGIVNAPSRGRLPGERAAQGSDATAIQAIEATPLSQERIEGPPPPTPLTDEQKAQKKAKAEADAAKLAAGAAGQPPAPVLPVPPPAAVPAPGPMLNTPPPPEEPPH